MPQRQKTYYYCRVFFDYYDNPIISNILRRMNGADIVVLHQKLIMATANTDNIYRYYGDDNDADHVDELAYLLRVDSTVIREGLEVLYRAGLIEHCEGGIRVPVMPEVIDTGSITSDAFKKQKQRRNNPRIGNKGDTREDNVPPEIKIESELDSSSSVRDDDEKVTIIIDRFNSVFQKKYKKNQKNKEVMSNALRRISLADAEAIIRNVHERYAMGEMGAFTPNIAWVFGAGLDECLQRLNASAKTVKNDFFRLEQREYNYAELERELTGKCK